MAVASLPDLVFPAHSPDADGRRLLAGSSFSGAKVLLSGRTLYQSLEGECPTDS
jgi:hypothetical protein